MAVRSTGSAPGHCAACLVLLSLLSTFALTASSPSKPFCVTQPEVARIEERTKGWGASKAGELQQMGMPMLRLRGGGLLSASISRWQHDDPTRTEPVHLTQVVNTTTVSWIGRSSVKEIMSLVMRTCVANTRPGDFARLEHTLHGKKCYCYVISKHNGLAGTLVTDEAYPQRVAINLVDRMLEEFEAKVDEFTYSEPVNDDEVPFPDLESLLHDYQDPAAADAISGLKKDLEESRQILQKSVDSVLQRGQKLEDLIMHSNKLSMQTKMMYKSVNQKPGWFEECCGVM